MIPRIICHKKSEFRTAYKLTKENVNELIDYMGYKIGDNEDRYAKITDEGITYGFKGSYEKSAKFGSIFVIEDSHDWWHNYSLEDFQKKFDVVPG